MREDKDNFLNYIPFPSPSYAFEISADKRVILRIEHRSVFDRIAQKLFRKPKLSYLRLDKLGSFLWLDMDGVKTVQALSEDLSQKFGEEAEPLLPRLILFLQELYANGFILYKLKAPGQNSCPNISCAASAPPAR